LKSPVPGDTATFRDVVDVGRPAGAPKPNLAVFEDRWDWITRPEHGQWAKYRAWAATHNNIPLADVVGDKVVVTVNGTIADLTTFPDLLNWRAPG
ncbi:MAG: hypothetical protein M3Q75_10400, partial [Gemmatimonadota bacterium]|nr:hypothetical protein [Gemmatimonadota bacterium]